MATGSGNAVYWGACMSKIAMEMLKDINKGTVDLRINYSQEEKESCNLPFSFP